MAYIYLNDIDFSMYCNKLEVTKSANYNAQTNAAGNTVVDLVNHKRTIKVGIIPIIDTVMETLQAILDGFTVTVKFLNPQTNELEAVQCIIPENSIDYYTIQANNTSFKAFELVFTEL